MYDYTQLNLTTALIAIIADENVSALETKVYHVEQNNCNNARAEFGECLNWSTVLQNVSRHFMSNTKIYFFSRCICHG